jgi:hypothetical protein
MMKRKWIKPAFLFMVFTGLASADDSSGPGVPAVLDSRKIPGVLASVTGVPYQRQEITNYYRSNSTRFPQFGKLQEVTPTFLVAELSYSSLFCSRWMDLEKTMGADQRLGFKAIDFAKPATQLQDEKTVQALVLDLAQQIWLRAPTSDEVTLLTAEIPALKLANLEDHLIAVCSLFASTPQFWMDPQ